MVEREKEDRWRRRMMNRCDDEGFLSRKWISRNFFPRFLFLFFFILSKLQDLFYIGQGIFRFIFYISIWKSRDHGNI